MANCSSLLVVLCSSFFYYNRNTTRNKLFFTFLFIWIWHFCLKIILLGLSCICNLDAFRLSAMDHFLPQTLFHLVQNILYLSYHLWLQAIHTSQFLHPCKHLILRCSLSSGFQSLRLIPLLCLYR